MLLVVFGMVVFGIEMDEMGACRRLLSRKRGPLRPAGWRWVSGIYDVWHWGQ